MKRLMVMMSLVAAGMFVIAGCTLGPYAPAIGYSNLKGPITSTGNVGGKVGKAVCKNYAGVYASGDASIEAAAMNGGIRRVNTVDYEVMNYGPFYIVTTTIVTGE